MIAAEAKTGEEAVERAKAGLEQARREREMALTRLDSRFTDLQEVARLKMSLSIPYTYMLTYTLHLHANLYRTPTC